VALPPHGARRRHRPGALARRLSFTDSLDWEIRAVEAAEPALAADQAALLRHAYDARRHLREATRFLAAGIFRGFAHLEKLTSAATASSTASSPSSSGTGCARPLRPWRLNPESRPTRPRASAVERERLCVFEAPPSTAPSPPFFAKTLAFADWDSPGDLRQPAHLLSARPAPAEKEQEYARSPRRSASNGRGYCQRHGREAGGHPDPPPPPYFERIKYCDETVVSPPLADS